MGFSQFLTLKSQCNQHKTPNKPLFSKLYILSYPQSIDQSLVSCYFNENFHYRSQVNVLNKVTLNVTYRITKVRNSNNVKIARFFFNMVKLH